MGVVITILLLEILRVGIIALPERFIELLLAVGVLTASITVVPYAKYLLLLGFLLALGKSTRTVYPGTVPANRKEFPVIAGLSIATAVVALGVKGVTMYLILATNLLGLYTYLKYYRETDSSARLAVTYTLISTLLGVAFAVLNQFPYLVILFLGAWVVMQFGTVVPVRMDHQFRALNLEAVLQQLGESFTTRTGVVFAVLVYGLLQLTALTYNPDAAFRAVEHLEVVPWFLRHSDIRAAGFYGYLLLVGLYGLAIFGFIALSLWFWGRTATTGGRLLKRESSVNVKNKMPSWKQLIPILLVGVFGVHVPQLILARITTSISSESAFRVAFAPLIAIAANEMYGWHILLILLMDVAILAAIIFWWWKWNQLSSTHFAHSATVAFLTFTTALAGLTYIGLLPVETAEPQLRAVNAALLYPLVFLFYTTTHDHPFTEEVALAIATITAMALIGVGFATGAIYPSGIPLIVGLCLTARWVDVLETDVSPFEPNQ